MLLGARIKPDIRTHTRLAGLPALTINIYFLNEVINEAGSLFIYMRIYYYMRLHASRRTLVKIV